MIREPHTIDKHDFGEDCPDCIPVCQDLLDDFLDWITYGERIRKLAHGKVAALFVIKKRMTPKEACKAFGITRMTLYRYNRELRRMAGHSKKKATK